MQPKIKEGNKQLHSIIEQKKTQTNKQTKYETNQQTQNNSKTNNTIYIGIYEINAINIRSHLSFSHIERNEKYTNLYIYENKLTKSNHTLWPWHNVSYALIAHHFMTHRVCVSFIYFFLCLFIQNYYPWSTPSIKSIFYCC